LGEQGRRARGECFVIATQQRHELGRDATGSHIGETFERNPPHAGIRIGEAPGQRVLHGLVALANCGKYSRRGRTQIHALRVEQIDDRSA
jgi:hypothetical protein